ncbi:TPA: hypothetical protein ACX6O7_003744 [Photobacterium damselae]
MKSFRRHWIASAVLGLPLLVGCQEGGSNEPTIEPTTPQKKAPVLSPVLLSQVLPVGKSSFINLSSAIASADDNNALQRIALRTGSSEGCDPSPNSKQQTAIFSPHVSDVPLLCAYDYTVGQDNASATSLLAFAAADGNVLTPTLPWLGAIGSVGEDITVTVAADGSLNTNVIVLGDTTTAPSVDTTNKTITFTGNTEGTTRVMYTVTHNGETQVGVADFTVSADVNTAPRATRGNITLPVGNTTVDLTTFRQQGSSSDTSLVQDRDNSGADAGTAGLSITNINAPLGVTVAKVANEPLKFTVTTTRAGIFPIFYEVTDGEGGYASEQIVVTVEGDTGLLLRDARYNLALTSNARELKINVADFAQVSLGSLSIVDNSVKITSKQAPSSTGYGASAVPSGNIITYRYDGNNKAGISNITYQVKDALTGLVANGNIFVSVGNQLPMFTSAGLTVTNNNSHATPETGDTLTPVASCDTATGCVTNKTKWEWRQSGDTVVSGVGAPLPYDVQYFPCDDTLELWATPVGTYNDNGQIKDVSGLPVKLSWVSPDVLTARLSKASAKEGEEVSLTLNACQAGTATVAITTGRDRQNRVQTDHLAKIKDGSTTTTSKTVNLDANGEATLTLVSPKGGLKSAINITSGSKSATEYVTFSTITSPNTPLANRYGFMTDYLVEGDTYLLRANLLSELQQQGLPIGCGGKIEIDNEEYALVLGSEYQTIFCGNTPDNAYGLNLTSPHRPTVSDINLFSARIPAPKTFLDLYGWNWNAWMNEVGTTSNRYIFQPTIRNRPVGLFISFDDKNLRNMYIDICAANRFIPIITTIKNPHTFAGDSGFPTTAFDGAQFKLNMSKDNTGYTFVSSDSTNAPVDANGVITINDKPAGEVTITASKDGEADFEYKFTIAEYYSNETNGAMLPPDQSFPYCANKGLSTPSREQLSNGIPLSRSVGTFWQEWGNMVNWGWGSSVGWILGLPLIDNQVYGIYQNSGEYTPPGSTVYPAQYAPYCYQ